MPWNEKSLRLRGLRDRLHLTGRNAPTFNQCVDIILEVLGLVHSPRNLSWCRRETAKLRDRHPEMTAEQLQRIGVLDERLARKAELIRARQERSKAKAGTKKREPKIPRPVAATPESPAALWQEILDKQEKTNRGT